uniref:Fungal lipase-type domain-containing protein n=1 Tax=viral metagenome TaxID=1070528 RepID=A0A6C0J878_9ZZZZ
MKKIDSFINDIDLILSSVYEFESIDVPLKSATLCSLAYKSHKDVTDEMNSDFTNIDFFDVNDIQYYIIKNGRTILFLFRGTDSLKDIKADIDITRTDTKYGKLHTGFLNSWAHIKDNVLENADKYDLIKCYGHSYGGALAMISSLFISEELFKRVHCYTFGCPRVGDSKFAKNFNKHIGVHRRYVDSSDPVIRIPSAVRFTHAGIQINIDNRPLYKRLFYKALYLMRGRIFHGHKMSHYVELCKKYNLS